MVLETGKLFLDLAIILFAAEVGGEIFKELGQTELLGNLFVGIVLGSSFLGVIHDTDLVRAFADVGLILLLFKVGLESSIDKILRNVKRSLILAVSGIITPFALGYLAAVVFGLEHHVGLFLGATLTATSIGITASVLDELGKIDTEEARIILGAAVFDDVIALLLLSFFSGEMLSGLSLIKSGTTAVAFLGVSIIIGLKAADYVLQIVEMMHVRGAEIIISFTFILVMAYFSEVVGLAPLIGAFAAGLIISRTHHRTEILKSIEPTTNIFIPIFFVLAGASVDLKQFLNYDILFFASVIIIVAIMGKMVGGLTVSGKLKRSIISAGMVPRGEVTLIFAGVGLANGIINSAIFSSIVMLTFVTSFIIPPFLNHLLKEAG